MNPFSRDVVVEILAKIRPDTILDAPSGGGWAKRQLPYECEIDGIDLYADPQPGYRNVYKADLNQPLDAALPEYAAILCCEGIEHFGNPLTFFQSARTKIKPGGVLIVTTPNVWYPAAKFQYFLRGFFPSFPCLMGKIAHGTHMHIMPWSFPQLYLYLTLAGYERVTLHPEPLSKAKHFWERILGFPQEMYCRGKIKKAKTEEEKNFWKFAGSEGSVYGRHLIVSAYGP